MSATEAELLARELMQEVSKREGKARTPMMPCSIVRSLAVRIVMALTSDTTSSSTGDTSHE